MSAIRVGIITRAQDLHGPVIAHTLRQRHGAQCYLIPVNRIAASGGLSYSNLKTCAATLPSIEGSRVAIGDLDVIWWRRFARTQELPLEPSVEMRFEKIVHRDTERALLGVALNEFAGVWVNHPLHTQYASNLINHLRAAHEAGFRVPATLVSQHPDDIRAFCAHLAGRVVVKDLGGSGIGTTTTMVTDALLAREDVLRLAPSVYQEYIPGGRHLRVHCFGDTCIAVLVESGRLDWRPDLNIPMRPFPVSPQLHQKLAHTQERLGIRMGIVDIKLTEHNEPVWLEVNPQGQFLFVEGLTGIPLADAFSDFLYAEGERGRSTHATSRCAPTPASTPPRG